MCLYAIIRAFYLVYEFASPVVFSMASWLEMLLDIKKEVLTPIRL